MLDKDTWIAQNLIPKNDVSTIRRPRRNVKSVNVFNATRKTSFTLCVLGSWAIYMPPYNIARLCSLTREAGYLTRVYDFNVDSHYLLKEANPDLHDAWNGANYWWWQDPEYYTRIHPTYEPFLKEHLEVLLADEPDILGFSCYYTNILPTLWMIKQIRARRPDITIVMGGPECHEKYFKKPKEVDYYFVGESEQNILDFLDNWEHGIKPMSPAIGSLYSDTRIDIDSLPYPDYSDFDLTKYWGKNSICAEISRGCIAKCSYCTEVYYWKFRDRGANNVVDELEYQVKEYGVTFVSFVDSLMNGNLKEFKKFCEELIKRELGFTWWGYARCDGRMDREYYEIMAAAGCQGFNYGIETGSDKVLKAINKKNTVAEINQNIIDSHAVGMKVSACWVIGAPGEDIEAFTHSFNMLWNHRERIIACSPGIGLGDNAGSDYDDREKYNINPRNTSYLGGWYTLDLTNTKLHRFIRVKLMHIWLKICKDYGGTITNVHSAQGDIADHYTLEFDSEYIKTHVEYEDFNYNIIQSGQGVFADSVMNEVFGFLRMLWRVRGGFEINLNFNKDLDHRDFMSAIVPNTHSYTADIWFKIDDDGNYSTTQQYKFINNFRDIVNTPGFDYAYESTGLWKESKKSLINKIFYIKTDRYENILPIESAFSSISIPERALIFKTARKLSQGSCVVEVGSSLGGRTSIVAQANKTAKITAIETFSNSTVTDDFASMSSWVEEQLVDGCKQLDQDKTVGIELLRKVRESFETDSSGKSAFEIITANYSNIHLSDTHNSSIDLCIVKNIDDNVSKWAELVTENGYMLVYPCDKKSTLLLDGWKIIESVQSMSLMQKQ
jgi:radical SAM superfamily enzyme YgiQ (UPF0313 family)